ncbi:MAG: isoleucyl-tRNA synthetase [Candidatus Parcubacteria bacterium]|jgi:isoleucyl-tRNA synthetase
MPRTQKKLKKPTKKIASTAFFNDGLRLPQIEEQVLQFWQENKIFEKSLLNTKGKKEFVFFEGPPTANGHPGIHHVLSRSFKDVMLRYKTMQGYSVPRRAGWDTQGLPVELQVEKSLGLKSKKDIEAYGIEAFNQKCRESVWQYMDEWRQLTRRMGFWIDEKNAYVTYDAPYIETLWWIIDEIYKKGLLYEGYKIVPWCSRCGTSLSSHELNQPGAYQEVSDVSAYVKFQLQKGQSIGSFTTTDNTYILSWTTTPWTLPGNVALAVGANIEYQIYKVENRSGDGWSKGGWEEGYYIGAKELMENVLDMENKKTMNYSIVATVKGSDLVGRSYAPLFAIAKLHNEYAHKIYPADFVTTTDGTGVVHIATMYGEDDYKLGATVGLPQHHTVDEYGKFTNDVAYLAGQYVKDPETEKALLGYLFQNDILFKKEKYKHEYPHCWRCNTPLLYYARAAWFVAVSKVKQKLIANNKAVSWNPAHIKTGRFGEWLADVKDWNFSRDRYWGTPLPIWRCDQCGDIESVSSMEELAKKSHRGNTYTVIRHSEASHNVKKIIASGSEADGVVSHLTKKGEAQIRALAKKLSRQKIDIIYTSPYERTKKMAYAIAQEVGCEVIEDARLAEINTGVYNGKSIEAYRKFFTTKEERLYNRPVDGESLADVRGRMVAALKDIDRNHKGKHIVIVSHGDPIWLAKAAFERVANDKIWDAYYPPLAGCASIPVSQLPFNRQGEIDPHRPFIDETVWKCGACDEGMKYRVKQLADVWFDSGCMPYAQAHFPFEKNQRYAKKAVRGIAFPADYITEGIDQTRGWFYTLLAVATLLDLPAPYKNVTCLGLINDKNGQKMSKSKGNIVLPKDMAEKFGLDAVRWYFFVVNPPGETKNFNEAEIAEHIRKLQTIIYNCFVFYKTYADTTTPGSPMLSKHILDQWIVMRINQTVDAVSMHMDAYQVREAGLAIQEVVDDLSRWYLRRSRRRLQKPEQKNDYRNASATLAYCLETVTRLLAPFVPFFAEAMYQEIASVQKKTKIGQSVHLQNFPRTRGKKLDRRMQRLMAATRSIASAGLAARATHGIKVRQPLAKLTLNETTVRGKKEYLEIIMDEVNVKSVAFDTGQEAFVALDTHITPELKHEGMIREVVRSIQELRQTAKLSPKDSIRLMYQTTDPTLQEMMRQAEPILRHQVHAKNIKAMAVAGITVTTTVVFDGSEIFIGIQKS